VTRHIAPGESQGEPTAADLAAIEAEWPLIEADLNVLDAEIRLLAAAGGPSLLDWRRLRRAEHQALAVAVRHGQFNGWCHRCGGAAPVGNLLCGGCEDAEAVLALAVLRSAVAS
jgi:hypothetical protein